MKRPLGKGALKEYSVNLDNTVEEIAWSLFDFTAYAAAGQTSLSFFQTPLGSGGKTVVDTNMELAGQIPKGQNFLVEAIAVEFFPGDDIETVAAAVAAIQYADDVKAVSEGGFLDFTVGSKSYKKEAPLGVFPPQYRLQGFAATATTGAANGVLVEYAQNVGAQHQIVPVRLTSNQNFLVQLQWPVVVALPSGTNGRIGIRLSGRLYRNAQ